MNPNKHESLLDLGCAAESDFLQFFSTRTMTIGVDINLNTLKERKKDFPNIQYILADGTKLPFKDQSVDIAFSNSVIEHVGNKSSQFLFASEILRVGKSHFIQTPNKFFPIEQHTFIPFFQFYPQGIQFFLTKFFPLGNYSRGASFEIDSSYLAKMTSLNFSPSQKFFMKHFLA